MNTKHQNVFMFHALSRKKPFVVFFDWNPTCRMFSCFFVSHTHTPIASALYITPTHKFYPLALVSSKSNFAFPSDCTRRPSLLCMPFAIQSKGEFTMNCTFKLRIQWRRSAPSDVAIKVKTPRISVTRCPNMKKLTTILCVRARPDSTRLNQTRRTKTSSFKVKVLLSFRWFQTIAKASPTIWIKKRSTVELISDVDASVSLQSKLQTTTL